MANAVIQKLRERCQWHNYDGLFEVSRQEVVRLLGHITEQATENKRLREALGRLGDEKIFVGFGSDNDELWARIEYARAALASAAEGEHAKEESDD